MVFSSLAFLCVFLPVVFLLHLVIPNMKVKNGFLILASLFFYAFGEPIYVVLMIASTLLNYLFGRLIAAAKAKSTDAVSEANAAASAGNVDSGVGAKSATHNKAKPILIIAVAANLAFIGIFKYAGMFASSFDAVFGLSLNIPVIALPIGISFYTFQAMSYVIDVYRDMSVATRSYAKTLLYISFFPQLIAGPIIKYHDVEDQLSKRTVTLEGIASGLRRFCVGLGKKVLIANTMAVSVDAIYGANLSEVNIAVAWIAALAYIMQIYFDFSGYSDMAIGMARMFGFHFKENFDYPYTSSSIKEFWRRWHISLSTWFKEYLYIPLGGNRKGRLRSGINKVIVFFCCGLWHGASWTFVVWGLFHGFFLLLEEYLPIRKLPRSLGVIYALLVVTVGFVLFRANTFEQGFYFITQMFTGFHFDYASMSLALQQLTPVFFVVFIVAIIACTPVKKLFAQKMKARGLIGTSSYVLAFGLLFLCLVSLSGGGYNPFIYFRF